MSNGRFSNAPSLRDNYKTIGLEPFATGSRADSNHEAIPLPSKWEKPTREKARSENEETAGVDIRP